MHVICTFAALLAPTTHALTAPTRARPCKTALRSIKVSYIEPDDAAEMGVREWPFSDRVDGAEETVSEGAQRYVLKGTGTVEASSYAGGVGDDEPQAVGPGSLVEASEQTNLRWRTEDGPFTVLTPSFEDWTEYLSTVAILVLFFGFLLANAGSFGGG